MQPLSQQPSNYFSIRDGKSGDHSFIFSSWLHSFRDSPFGRHVSSTDYFKGQHAIIESLLAREATRVFIVHSLEDVEQILAYAVWEHTEDGPILHYLYSKLPFRGLKIASTLYALIQAQCPGTVRYTHLPKLADKLLAGKSVQFNPYLAWRKQ